MTGIKDLMVDATCLIIMGTIKTSIFNNQQIVNTGFIRYCAHKGATKK
jgi:hypothetical protein